jgi:hypothetical protein
VIGRAIFAGAAVLAAMSCLVDRKSDALACSTSADCSTDRTCEAGYCVKQSSSGCPAHCATCDTTSTPHVCLVTNTDGDDFTCPDGFHCLITCGAGACGDITCTNACACDVTCNAGGCQTIECPHTGANYCTPDKTDGPACTSMAGGRCNSC